ncbi:Hypothetical predicted protein [Octopus vulgaris]|uniref:Uncharacterized protein n=1 Tax=Octopus vulgaris TaxID=6645 RepID=A0AA36BKE9_OCTVU|nr:Hypothetical predicted protein [Octopus vulgaris]
MILFRANCISESGSKPIIKGTPFSYTDLLKYFCGINQKRHATENDINIRHKGNEESDEQYSPPRGLIERLPSDQSTQRPEDTRNSIVPVKDSQENEKTTVTEDLAFAEEHRESIAEMRQKILNTLEVVRHTNVKLKDMAGIKELSEGICDKMFEIKLQSFARKPNA